MENEITKITNDVSLTLPELEVLDKKIKAMKEKLKLCAEKAARERILFEGHNMGGCDESTDKEGYYINRLSTDTKELTFVPTVMLLVVPGTEKKEALRIINKITKLIKKLEEPFKTIEDVRLYEGPTPF